MEEIESLEKLSSDYYRKKYQRETEYGFSGEQTFPSHILSNGMVPTTHHSEGVDLFFYLFREHEKIKESLLVG